MMQGTPTRSESSDARWLRWSLTAIAVLLAVIVIQLSVLIGPTVPAAQAQIPDSGAQLQQLIQAQTEANLTLKQILDHLQTGQVKVVNLSTDKESKGAPAPAQRPARITPKTTQKSPRAQ